MDNQSLSPNSKTVVYVLEGELPRNTFEWHHAMPCGVMLYLSKFLYR